MIDGERLLLLVNRVAKEISLRELVYTEAHNREVSFHTVGEELRAYCRTADLQKELPSNFCRCHRSFIVNINYVDRIDGNDVVMITGDRIPLPRKKRRAFIERISKTTIRE